MAQIIPTKMIGIPPHSLIVNPRGTVSEVGEWTRLTRDHAAISCTRIIDGSDMPCDPDEIAALIVPSTQDAILNLIAAGFQIKSAEIVNDEEIEP